MKPKGHLHLATYCKELLPFGAAQNASTLTVLLPFTDVGSENQAIKVTLENEDLTNTCDLIVEPSHNGTFPDALRRQVVTVQPQSEGSIEIHDLMDTFVRVSAQTASPAFPVVSLKWGIVARER
jgi:hypothetical protein